MSLAELKKHYEAHPYPCYPLLASIKRADTYPMNLMALWARFNGERINVSDGRILLAGSGSFSPYPFSVSNPESTVDAVDLSNKNILRSRLHCLLHRCFNIRYFLGDFQELSQTLTKYHLIESFGVIHHLENPLSALQALQKLLLPGGIIRIMVYGRYARREVESIRRAIKLLDISDLNPIKKMIRKASPESKFRDFINSAWEAETDSGLADMFLNPDVKTYRMSEFMEMVDKTELRPLLFTHDGAVADVEEEIKRMKELDAARKTDTNIICYLGYNCNGEAKKTDKSKLILNPSLIDSVSLFKFAPSSPINRLGFDNPEITADSRRFLRRFIKPIVESTLSIGESDDVEKYLRALYLVRFK